MTLKVAVTDWSELIVTEQEPAPVQAPDQPPNVDVIMLGAAFRLTNVPVASVTVHVPLPQKSAPGDPLTLPVPIPAMVIVSV
jgi:hypothetical protein